MPDFAAEQETTSRVRRACPPEPSPVPPLSDLTGSRPVRILVADDDPTTAALLEQVLSSDGYRVELATSGEDALLRFQISTPDLVLLDVMMPGIDGFETCARMRQLDPHHDVPVVMLTGTGDYEAVDRAFAAQATDFITKPFQWRLLLQRLRYALRTGRLNRELRLNRAREATARRLARLNFFHWNLDTGLVSWSDDNLPLSGATVTAPLQFHLLVEMVMPQERQRVGEAIRRTRLYGEALDIESRVLADGREHLLRLVAKTGNVGADKRIVSGAIQDVTEQRHTERLAAAAPVTSTDASLDTDRPS